MLLTDRIQMISGTDVWMFLATFCIYSILGWCVESAYMSLCNRKLTNRGFAKGPFCPIYGVGAMGCYMLLSVFADNVILLYFAGAITATVFEYMVGRMMLKLFGEVWWDYNGKPFNYQGIICLESTIAWGFYAVIIIGFLHRVVTRIAKWYTYNPGLWILKAVLLIFAIDFLWHLLAALHIDISRQKERLREKYYELKDRWY